MRAGQTKVRSERRKSKRVYLASGEEGVLNFVEDYYNEGTAVFYPELDDATLFMNLDTGRESE